MEGVPSPLRVGSPLDSRRPSLRRQGNSGSDRLAQLFPSRPESAASPGISPPAASRRTSHPSPLTPAAEPAYRIPRAPAPPALPTFSEDTSYSASGDPFAQQRSPPGVPASGTKRLLSRLTSLRSGRGHYNKLEDVEAGARKGRLKDVDEDGTEDVEPVGYDLSGYDMLPLTQLTPLGDGSAADAIQQERNLNEAGFAAEYERLEGQLGAGMSAVHEVPFTFQAQGEQKALHKRGVSNVEAAEAAARQDGQKEAEKVGGIVAVADMPLDISETFHADFDTRSILTTNQPDHDGSKTSYYFPEDPDMPAWRPFSMGWPWLSMLVVIALALAGLQEFLCQLSIRRAKDDPLNGGLIKFKKPGDLSVTEYFTWKYAPVFVFVIYGILWQISDYEVKRLEPFYQLSKNSGASAAESVNMDYLTFLAWLVPIRAVRHKQYAVVYVSLATLVASSLVPVLQSASVKMYPPQKERKVDEWKSIRIDPPWSRAVTACLVIVAICGGILMYEMRRKSGLLSDPKGIAGVAAMATRSHILTDFHGLDTAPLDRIHKQLRHRRYILHKSSLWQGEYIRNSTERVREHGSDPRPLMLRLRAGVPYVCYIVLFTISIPIFMFVSGAVKITEKLPFLLTALATIVKLLWSTVNCDIRMLEPFYILANRRAPAKTLTLDYTATNPMLLPFRALQNRHYLVALVGVGSILTEVLTVCVSSFSVDGKKFIPGHGGEDDEEEDDAFDRYNTDETFRSFWISFAIVLSILFTLVAIACLVYLRRSHKFMPRQIGTIASVLAFIHQSKMLVQFVDTEKMDSSAMEKHLEKEGKTYGLGWFSGRDGDDHCGIDEEPLLAGYSYGVDWTKTRVLGNQIGTWEHY